MTIDSLGTRTVFSTYLCSYGIKYIYSISKYIDSYFCVFIMCCLRSMINCNLNPRHLYDYTLLNSFPRFFLYLIKNNVNDDFSCSQPLFSG